MSYDGMLFIGDPHLASRTPGFRCDDYPRVALDKLSWCLKLARDENLLPILLGDLFHWPRENANWLLAELVGLFQGTILSIPGNHDCHENQLGNHDSLMILYRAGSLALLDRDGPWEGDVCGHKVCVGGTGWGQRIPASFERPEGCRAVFWITHHDIAFTGPTMARRPAPRTIDGVDVVINGHIHNREPVKICGQTVWLNPGNICRLSRDELIRHHTPAVLRIDLDADGQWNSHALTVPHASFDEVFFEKFEGDPELEELPEASAFIKGLEELAARRTASGAGLVHFLDQNLPQFDPRIADTIKELALEVLPDDHPWKQQHERSAGHLDPEETL